MQSEPKRTQEISYSGDALEEALGSSFLKSVDPRSVDRLLARARFRDVSAGRNLVEMESPHRCGLVVRGAARAYLIRADGSQITQRRLATGASVGLRAIFGGQNRLTVQAITDVEFVEFDPALLLALAGDDSSLAMAIAREIDRQLADSEVQLASLRARVIQKVASALLDCCSGGHPPVVSLSQEALAERVGASRERVGQELRRLAEQRIISIRRVRLVIVDPIRLQRVADQLADLVSPTPLRN